MTDRSRTRLVVLQVLVLSLLAALVGRLWYMQVVAGDEYQAEASENRIREVVTPAVRGAILDAQGRPLVQNRTSLVVSVDRSVILDLPEDGEQVVDRLAGVLGITPTKLDRQLTLCGAEGAAKPPVCWNGSPYQPIPVAEDVKQSIALEVMERSEEFPGVTAEMTAIRDYPEPFGVRAPHVLGYVGPISAEELAAAEQEEGRRNSTYTNFDLIGKAGLEQVYDDYLRGRPGVKKLAVDSAGDVTGTVAERDAVPGDYLVTSIDAHVQKVTETQLRAAIDRAHQAGVNGTESSYPANTGAAVVMEVDTGRVVAMASYPDYDPSVWVGGVSNKQYKRLSNENRSKLLNRAISGEYAPASTFKIVTTAAAVNAGFSLSNYYPCSEYFQIPGSTQTFRNFEAGMNESMPLTKALAVSCNTVFFGLAYDMYVNEGGVDAGANAPEYLMNTARSFGYGSTSGIDLPSEQDGRVPDRKWRQDFWEANKSYYCNYEKTASPSEPNYDYLTELYGELCVDGYQMRPGDAIQAAIGQGDVLATPLQVARAYAAIANGGTLYKPQVARAVMAPNGELVKEFKPKANGTIDASSSTIDYIQNALAQVTQEGGSAGYRYVDFPQNLLPIAAKTGTGQVEGKATTSWFASYAPANNPKYVIVMMVPEGGTGSGTSAPSVNEIYRAIFGIEGMTLDPKRAMIPRGRPIESLPTINPDGTIDIPRDDGQPGSSESGLPATSKDSTKKQQNRRRRRSTS